MIFVISISKLNETATRFYEEVREAHSDSLLVRHRLNPASVFSEGRAISHCTYPHPSHIQLKNWCHEVKCANDCKVGQLSTLTQFDPVAYTKRLYDFGIFCLVLKSRKCLKHFSLSIVCAFVSCVGGGCGSHTQTCDCYELTLHIGWIQIPFTIQTFLPSRPLRGICDEHKMADSLVLSNVRNAHS